MYPHLRMILNQPSLVAFCLFVGMSSGTAQPGLLSARQVGPGVLHSKFLLSGPLTVDVLSVSLREPTVRIETYRPEGLTETTDQAEANDRPGHRVLGAVNADFFSFQTGWPVGNQMVNGTWVLGTRSARSHMAIDAAGRPFIERITFTGSVTASSGTTFPLAGVNIPHRANPLVLSTTFHGTLTAHDSVLGACVVRFIDSTLTAGDTLRAVALANNPGDGMPVMPGTAVLSASADTGVAFLASHVHIGDTLRLLLGTAPGLRGITQIIGGCGRFLAGGRDVTDSTSRLEGITERFTGVRHPRTFTGFDRDSTMLYICTVDGRQSTSIGMTFADMASFLLSLGATEGFNLDGGGSTTMVVQGTIVNAPSDKTGERPVANSLQVISTAPDSLLHPPTR